MMLMMMMIKMIMAVMMMMVVMMMVVMMIMMMIVVLIFSTNQVPIYVFVGPAGTGKTESVKALGHQLGRFVLVFNCDEKFDFQVLF
jgi:ATP-dependent Clp protease ATP-binding subunit ClpA